MILVTPGQRLGFNNEPAERNIEGAQCFYRVGREHLYVFKIDSSLTFSLVCYNPNLKNCRYWPPAEQIYMYDVSTKSLKTSSDHEFVYPFVH